MMAHVNTTGRHIQLYLVGDNPGLGGFGGRLREVSAQESAFFGNIFAQNPQNYYCHGWGFTNGVVEGRLGGGQGAVPYTDPFNGGLCSNNCTGSDNPNVGEGFKACNGWNHVITVWRTDANPQYDFEFDAQGWAPVSASSSMLQAATSTAKSQFGKQSLAITIPGLNGGSRRIEAATSLIPSGSACSFKLWVPRIRGW